MKTRKTPHRTTRGFAVAVVALFVLAALPAVPTVADDPGDISRTFTYYALARAEFKDTGLGWYDAGPPVVNCLFIVLGVQIPVAGSFYYETGRAVVNFNKLVLSDATSVSQPTPGVCPAELAPPLPGPANPAIQYHGVNLFTGWYLSQSALLCTQKAPFTTCTASDVNHWYYACGVDNTDFITAPLDGKETLTMFVPKAIVKTVTGGDGQVGSRGILCDQPDHAHNVTEKLHLQGAMTSSGFAGAVPVDRVVHAGAGDSYAVSCLEVKVEQFNPGPPAELISRTDVTHDWVLVLDRASPGTWDSSLLNHLVDPTTPHLVPGWYDLGGHNGCEWFTVGPCEQEDKKGTADVPVKTKPGKDPNELCAVFKSHYGTTGEITVKNLSWFDICTQVEWFDANGISLGVDGPDRLDPKQPKPKAPGSTTTTGARPAGTDHATVTIWEAPNGCGTEPPAGNPPENSRTVRFGDPANKGDRDHPDADRIHHMPRK